MGRQDTPQGGLTGVKISTLASSRGATRMKIKQMHFAWISTLSPSCRATGWEYKRIANYLFQLSPLLVGRRHADSYNLQKKIIFQLSPLLEGRLGTGRQFRGSSRISTLATTRGATKYYRRTAATGNFNSRHYSRGDGKCSPLRTSPANFNSRPYKRGDPHRHCFNSARQYFNSRHYSRGDHPPMLATSSQ